MSPKWSLANGWLWRRLVVAALIAAICGASVLDIAAREAGVVVMDAERAIETSLVRPITTDPAFAASLRVEHAAARRAVRSVNDVKARAAGPVTVAQAVPVPVSATVVPPTTPTVVPPAATAVPAVPVPVTTTVVPPTPTPTPTEVPPTATAVPAPATLAPVVPPALPSVAPVGASAPVVLAAAPVEVPTPIVVAAPTAVAVQVAAVTAQPALARTGPSGVVSQIPASAWRWLEAYGWKVDWRQGPGPGRLAEAQYATSTIVIWHEAGRSNSFWAGAFAHELGHAVSYMHFNNQQMNEWNAMRGLSSWRWVPGTPNDFGVGEGDFAEAFMSYLFGHQVRSAGGPLTPQQRAWISANTTVLGGAW